MIKKYYGWRIGGVLGPPGPPLGYAHACEEEEHWFNLPAKEVETSELVREIFIVTYRDTSR